LLADAATAAATAGVTSGRTNGVLLAPPPPLPPSWWPWWSPAVSGLIEPALSPSRVSVWKAVPSVGSAPAPTAPGMTAKGSIGSWASAEPVPHILMLSPSAAADDPPVAWPWVS
jgi:hypothetical protein